MKLFEALGKLYCNFFFRLFDILLITFGYFWTFFIFLWAILIKLFMFLVKLILYMIKLNIWDKICSFLNKNCNSVKIVASSFYFKRKSIMKISTPYYSTGGNLCFAYYTLRNCTALYSWVNDWIQCNRIGC